MGQHSLVEFCDQPPCLKSCPILVWVCDFCRSRKLKYQTDKLLRIAMTPVHTGPEEASAEAGDADDDPLSYRPRPEAMIPRGQDEGRGSVRGESPRSVMTCSCVPGQHAAPEVYCCTNSAQLVAPHVSDEKRLRRRSKPFPCRRGSECVFDSASCLTHSRCA